MFSFRFHISIVANWLEST